MLDVATAFFVGCREGWACHGCGCSTASGGVDSLFLVTRGESCGPGAVGVILGQLLRGPFFALLLVKPYCSRILLC